MHWPEATGMKNFTTLATTHEGSPASEPANAARGAGGLQPGIGRRREAVRLHRASALCHSPGCAGFLSRAGRVLRERAASAGDSRLPDLRAQPAALHAGKVIKCDPFVS